MKPRRLLFLGSLVLAVAIIGVFEYLNFSGYCYSERRYLSDRELIEKAVQYNLKNPPGVGG
jgi:hypothetical protein